jgi:gamma-glutamyltranspeptidase / glutathione hydrolase
MEILQGGGNAVDAAVTAMIALGVVTPASVGLGGFGGSMVLYRAKDRRVIALDFDSRAPLEYRPELFAANPSKLSDVGYLAPTAPGVLGGLAEAVKRFGRRSWADVSRPAIELAEKGFPLDAGLKGQIDKWVTQTDPLSLRAFLPNGRVPQVGERFVQADLGQLMRGLADEGPESFYRGRIPEKIVRQVRAHGGILSEPDFQVLRPEVVEPARITYRGSELFTPPPPSGGLTSFQILQTLEHFDLTKMEPWSAEYFHLFSQVANQCWRERQQTLGDPDVIDVPLDELLSPAGAAKRAELVRSGLKTQMHPPGPSPSHTASVVAADAEGNWVALLATHGFLFGSRVVIDGLGLVLGNGMWRFDFKEDSPNVAAPGKRMQHNMAPVIMMREGRCTAGIGLPGGPKIVTVTAQIAINLIDFGMHAQAAVTAPRIHSEGDDPLAASSAVPDSVIEELKRMGHTIRRGQDWGGPPMEIAGIATVVAIHGEGMTAGAGQ